MGVRLMSEEQLKKAWEFVTVKCFQTDVNLLCDHILHNDATEFATAEEANHADPNGCGYGCGMEDGMINGGTMMDACLLRYELEKSKEAAEFALKLADGMLNCVASAKSEGFVPRSVVPEDGKSHFPDSSRDQYTMFAFGIHRFFRSSLCTEAYREKIGKACAGIANRAERNVIAENDYDMLRDDGGKTLVTKMWGNIGNHEYGRLPMLYILAWETTHEQHYLDLYRSVRQEAYDKALPFPELGYWAMYALQQMQASLLVCMEADPDEGWKEKYLSLMTTVAEYIADQTEKIRAEIEKLAEINLPYPNFRSCPVEENKWFALLGVPNRIPRRSDDSAYWKMQDVANIVNVIKMVPDFPLPKKTAELYRYALQKIDFERYERVTPVHYLEAYYRAAK